MNKEGIEKASQIINQGGIVIFPTDTVYGIGCNPYNKESVKKIYEIKSRDIIKTSSSFNIFKEIAEKIVEFLMNLLKKLLKNFGQVH